MSSGVSGEVVGSSHVAYCCGHHACRTVLTSGEVSGLSLLLDVQVIALIDQWWQSDGTR